MVTSLTNLIKQKDTRSNLTLGNTGLNLHCNAIDWFLYGWNIGLKWIRQRAQLSTWKQVHAPTISTDLANEANCRYPLNAEIELHNPRIDNLVICYKIKTEHYTNHIKKELY